MASKTSTTDSTTADTTAAAAVPADVAPKVSPLTNAYAFDQAVQWLNKVAQQAQSLGALQAFLANLANDTAALVGTVDDAERKTVGRITAGVPTVLDAAPVAAVAAQ